MLGLPISDDVLQMAGQAIAIALVARLIPNRALLVVVAIAAGAAGLALGMPGDFSKTPGALLLDFSGVFAGLALGALAIADRERRDREALVRRMAARHGTQRAGLRPMAAGVVVIVVLALGAASWHYLRDGVPGGWPLADSPAPGPKASAGVNRPNVLPVGAKGAAHAAGASVPRPQERLRAERPQGDLRHCLERGGGQDVLRCAEGR